MFRAAFPWAWVFVPGMLAWPMLCVGEPISIPTSLSQRPLLKSIYSEVHQVSEFRKSDTKAIVFVFLGIECPVSQQYIPRLNDIRAQYAPRHIQFVAIYPDASVNVLRMATHAHDNDISFPVFLDQEQRLADLLEVTVVPEVVVLDAKLEKRYQGAIDNQFKKRGQLAEATKPYLIHALDQILANGVLDVASVPASGCPLERRSASDAHRGQKSNLTFHRDIEPLVQKHCQTCHRSQGVAPFELTTFDDVSLNSEKIEEAISERRMPPWHGYLNSRFGTLLNDKRMSDEEIDRLLTWIRDGAPRGDLADAPARKTWPAPGTWEIGTPDYVYRINPPFQLPKTGIVEYQFFRVKMDAPEDRWYRAIEIKPGNAEVVHHITLHLVDAGGKSFTSFLGMAALYGLNTQRARLLNDYLPGDTYNAKTHRPEEAVRIPKHSDLIFEIHYTPNNREATTDQSMVAFKWAPTPPEHEVLTTVFRRPVGRFEIPAHDPHFRMEDTYFFEHDVEIDTIRPHFHFRGKSYRLEIIERNDATEAIERTTTVLSIPVYDFSWQRTYELATPLFIPAGTELRAVAHFDNSEFNPRNPDPSVAVHWGEGTTDEMFSTRFKYRVVGSPPVDEPSRAKPSGSATSSKGGKPTTSNR